MAVRMIDALGAVALVGPFFARHAARATALLRSVRLYRSDFMGRIVAVNDGQVVSLGRCRRKPQRRRGALHGRLAACNTPPSDRSTPRSSVRSSPRSAKASRTHE